MVCIGILLNYILLRILTEKVIPPGKLKGLPGETGPKGDPGEKGRLGKKGPLNAVTPKAWADGDRGVMGNLSECADGPVENHYGNVVGGCSSVNNWEMMGLTSYPASKKDGCLFGYKKMKGGICKAPITGINQIDGDFLRQYSIRDWEDEKTKTNCSYIDDVIKNFHPAQFKKWAELMASRGCPGVPHNGLVPGIPEGSASISSFTNNKWKVCPVTFRKCTGCHMYQAADICSNVNMKVASPGQVQYAFENCSPKLNTFAYGRISNGQFAVPIQKDTSSFKKGVNIPAIGGNQGVFCTASDAPDVKYEDPYIYAVGKDHKVYKILGRKGSTWEKVSNSGMMTQIDTDETYIYGVGMPETHRGRQGGSSVYKMSKAGGNWTKVAGCCIYQISVSHGYIYGIGSNNNVYRVGVGGGSWQHITPGSVKHITVSDKAQRALPIIYGVGTNNNVYGTAALYGSIWRSLHRWIHHGVGSVVQTSISDGIVYGLGTDGSAYKLVNKNNWQNLGGTNISGILMHKGKLVALQKDGSLSIKGVGQISGPNSNIKSIMGGNPIDTVSKCKKYHSGNWQSMCPRDWGCCRTLQSLNCPRSHCR